MRRALLVLTLGLCLAGCSQPPQISYPPPIQRELPVSEKKPVGNFIGLGDPEADDYIVGGIQPTAEGSGWRWTHEAPEMRFRLDKAEKLKFTMLCGFPEYNFKQTGPVTLTFYVNGQLLDTVRYTTPGDRTYEKPVKSALLKAGEFNLVRIVVDPPWVAPSDKAKLGFVLHRAGFLPQ